MWQPNRRQWLVIWIAAPLSWAAYVLPGTESLEEVETQVWSLILIGAALLVWKFADPAAADAARPSRSAKPPAAQPSGRVLGWLLAIGLLGAILLRLNAVQTAIADLVQPSDLSDIQSSLKDIGDKLDR